MPRNKILAACLALALLFGFAGAARALVDLEWRPAQQTVSVGDSVVAGLYAVSDSPEDHLISAMDVVVLWDASFLGAPALGDPQPCWLTDGFFASAPGGINDDLADGSVMYTAWANFGAAAQATPEGLLCVEFEFPALAPVDPTSISIAASFGEQSETKVFDGTSPNLDVKGTLGSAEATILVPEPAPLLALGLGIAPLWIRRKHGA